jgi:hypothetical protein
MWWWFIIWLIIIFALLSGTGYCRSYYGPAGVIGVLVLLFVPFWLAVVFAGPYWGWYGRWW